MRLFYITIIFHFSIASQAQPLEINADIRGTNDASDGGTIQLATPSLNHFLRLTSGQNNDSQPLLYFSKEDTFSINSGTEDWLDIRRNISLYNGLGTGSSPTTFLGINTGQPLRELDIRTNHINDGSELNLGNADNSHFLRFFSGRQNLNIPLIYWKDGDTLSFGTDLNTYTERMRITSDGMMGLGTNDPQARLGIKLNSTVVFPHIDLVEDDDVDFARIRLRNGSIANHWDIAANAINFGLLNFHYSGFGDILSIRSNGRVGISHVDPQAKLHVVSTGGDDAAKFDGKVDFTDQILLNGTAGAAGQVLTSNGAGDPTWTNISSSQIGFSAYLTSNKGLNTSVIYSLFGFTEDYDHGT
ncbi:MAG: hypothetical protein OEQ53_02895, partial [Saprospiraceae bacterium]|nr:hypothetical protein [Saprospiraceae bacterium]